MVFSYLCLGLAQFLFQSCGDDDPAVNETPEEIVETTDQGTPDTEAPDISVINITEGQEIWNNVVVEVAATDNALLNDIKVFVDNVLIATLTSQPFSAIWDSNTVADGPHTIKITGSDDSGNETVVELAVTVKNILAAIDVSENVLGNGAELQRGFIFLSDKDGQVITSHEFENGESFELKDLSFNGVEFYLTLALVRTSDEGDIMLLDTYAEMTRGMDSELNVILDAGDPHTGTAILTLSGSQGGMIYRAHSQKDYAVFTDNSSASVELNKTPSMLYVTKSAGAGEPAVAYHVYSNITTGENPIDLSLVTEPLAKVTATSPDGSPFNVSIYGYDEAGLYENSFDLGYFSGSGSEAVEIYYPANAFPAIYFAQTLLAGDVLIMRGSREPVIDLEPVQHNVTFDFNGNAFTYSATGNFDYLAISSQNETETVSWSFMLPKASGVTIPALTLPADFQDYDIPDIGNSSSYRLYDYEGITDYEDVKEYVMNTSLYMDEFGMEGKNYYTYLKYPYSGAGARLKRSTVN